MAHCAPSVPPSGGLLHVPPEHTFSVHGSASSQSAGPVQPAGGSVVVVVVEGSTLVVVVLGTLVVVGTVTVVEVVTGLVVVVVGPVGVRNQSCTIGMRSASGPGSPTIG